MNWLKPTKTVTVGFLLFLLAASVGSPLVSAQGPVNHSVAWSPDGALLAVTDRQSIQIQNDRGIVLNHLGDFALLNAVPTWSRDSRQLAIANGTEIQLWDQPWSADGARRIAAYDTQTSLAVSSVAWSPVDDVLAIGVGAQVILWDYKANQRLHELSTQGIVSQVAWSHDGQFVAAGTNLAHITIWDSRTGQVRHDALVTANRPIPEDRPGVWSVSWSPDDSALAIAAEDGTVRVWYPAASHPLTALLDSDALPIFHPDGALVVTWSPEVTHLASGGWDGMVRVWDLVAQEQSWEAETGNALGSLAWSPDGRRLAYWSGMEELVIHDIADSNPAGSSVQSTATPIVPDIARNTLASVAWSPEGRRLAVSDELTFEILDAETLEVLARLTDFTGRIRTLAWSPDGSLLAIAAGTSVELWNTAPLQLWESLTESDFPVIALAWSPDGTQLAGLTGFGTRVWDVETSQIRHLLTGHILPMRDVAWSPDGSQLITAGDDSTALIWDANTGDLSGAFVILVDSGSVPILSVTWSPDGSLIATASEDGVIRLWDATASQASTQPLTILRWHTGVYALEWSPDGSLLASGSLDGTIKLWNALTLEYVSEIESDSPFYALAWSPDGRRLAYWSAEAGLVIRDVTVGGPDSTPAQ